MRRWMIACGAAAAVSLMSCAAGAGVSILEQAIDALAAEIMAEERIPGAAVAIVHDGEVTLLRGYGVQDVETGRAVDPTRTIFRIGSISKAVTALGMLAAVDCGLLSLDDPVRERAPDLLDGDPYGEPVRVRHLLEHTGGFDQIGSRRNFDRVGDRPDLRSFLSRELVAIRPPGREPCYDTYGVSLAGELLARSMDGSYAQAMERLVFSPLGMARTSVETPPRLLVDLATGYGLTDDGLLAQAYEHYATTPASSIDSTASDMARLMLAIAGDGSNESGRIFSAAMAATLHAAPARRHDGIAEFVWGFWESFDGGRRALTHGGTMRGYSAQLHLAPAERFGVFVALTRDAETGPAPTLGAAIVEAAVRISLGEGGGSAMSSSIERPTVAIDTTRYAGRYVSNLFCHTCLEGEGWRPGQAIELLADGPGRLRSETTAYLAVGPLLFEAEDSGRRLGFFEDESGRICAVVTSTAAPGLVLERVDDRLAIEVARGAGAEASRPTRALVLRVTGRHAEAAREYDSLAVRAAPDSVGAGFASLRAAESYLAAGHFNEADARASRAREVFAARGAAPTARMALFLETQARVGAGKIDEAIDALELAIAEFGAEPAALLDDLADAGLLEAFAGRPRFEAIRGRLRPSEEARP